MHNNLLVLNDDTPQRWISEQDIHTAQPSNRAQIRGMPDNRKQQPHSIDRPGTQPGQDVA